MANDTDIASVLYQDSSGRLTPVGRENFLRGVVNGLIYILAETLMDPTLVLVSFVSSLTNNPLLIGLIVPLRDGTWYLPQLFVSGHVQSMPRKIEHYKIYSYVRTVLWILLALSINLIREPVFLLVAFFLTYGGVSLASGLCGLSFLEVVSKTIPARRRGEFYALRFGFGSLLGVGGSLGVRWLLDPTSPIQFPANFGVLSIAYAALASFSLFLYNGVREHPDENLRPASPFGEQIKRAWYYIRTDPNYFRFLSMQSSLIIGGMATPFFAVYVQQQLGGPREMVGVYLAVQTATNLVGNLLYGRMSYKSGNQRVIQFASISGIIMSCMALGLALFSGQLHISGITASYLLIPVFVFSGMRSTGMGVSSNSLLLEIAPPSDRSLYIGFTNSSLGIVMLLTSLSGVVMALLGFQALVIISLCFHVIALITVRSMKKAGFSSQGR